MERLPWKTEEWVFKKLKLEFSQDLAIPFLGIHLKELKAESQKTFVHPNSQRHYPQQLKVGRNVTVHRQMNE